MNAIIGTLISIFLILPLGVLLIAFLFIIVDDHFGCRFSDLIEKWFDNKFKGGEE